MTSSDDVLYASSSMKIPILNGTNRSKYQDQENDSIAVLQYYDLEKYVEDVWKGKDMPLKTRTNDKKLLQREKMKKDKAIWVRGTKDLLNMITREADTTYAALNSLKKCAVKKIREDFDTLDIEWNKFKVNNVETDPDLVFKKLEEQSRKLSVLDDKYIKDTLQILSKLKYPLPAEYDHVLTYLNTNEEHQKSYEHQLETTKLMIQSHYRAKIIGNTSGECFMVCIIGTPNLKKKDEPWMKCAYCGENTHTKMRNGKLFSFKLIKDLKKKNKRRSTLIRLMRQTSTISTLIAA